MINRNLYKNYFDFRINTCISLGVYLITLFIAFIKITNGSIPALNILLVPPLNMLFASVSILYPILVENISKYLRDCGHKSPVLYLLFVIASVLFGILMARILITWYIELPAVKGIMLRGVFLLIDG